MLKYNVLLFQCVIFRVMASQPSLKKDEFLRNNAVFFVGSLMVAFLNYAYHPIISRLLSVEEFGQVQGYLSIAMQLGVVATVFGMVLLNIKTNSLTKDDEQKSVSAVYSLGLLVAVILSIGLLVLSPWLQSVFSLDLTWGWILVSAAVFLGMPKIFAKFHLQAEKRFALVSFVELFIAAGKILIALLLFWFGYGVSGAVGGFVLALLCGLILSYPYSKSTLSPRTLHWPRLNDVLKKEIKYGGMVLAAIGFITFLYTADILIMRYFFDEVLAGQYAGIATVARTIVFATASIGGVLLSHVTRQNSTEENKKILKKGLALTIFLGAGALAIFSVFPEFMVRVMMGETFLPMAGLLPLLSFAMLLVSVVNLLIMYCVALRIRAVVPIVLVGALTIAISVSIWHAAASNVVYSFIAGLTVVLLSLTILISKQSS